MKEGKRDWAVTEHMTFNGDCFNQMDDATLQNVLENTLNQGTRFGWEFVSVTNSSQGGFSLYNDDWSPKRVMSFVDCKWPYWMKRAREIDNAKAHHGH